MLNERTSLTVLTFYDSGLPSSFECQGEESVRCEMQVESWRKESVTGAVAVVVITL